MSAPAASTSHEPVLLHHRDAGVTTLTLNRPESYNALSEEMLSALLGALADVASDPSTRVVVLAAAGKAFCAGHDLKQMREHPSRDYYQDLFSHCSRVMQAILDLPKPVVARVHGVAAAAGCQLVATCDLAIASREARFAVSGVKLGLFCSTPGVALSRNVSRKRAFEMLVTGDFIDAPTAERYGLINRAVPADELDAEIKRLARSIIANPAIAVETGKRMFYRQLEQGIGDAYAYAGDVMACNMMAEDAAEGVDAFIEKRDPNWRRS